MMSILDEMEAWIRAPLAHAAGLPVCNSWTSQNHENRQASHPDLRRFEATPSERSTA